MHDYKNGVKFNVYFCDSIFLNVKYLIKLLDISGYTNFLFGFFFLFLSFFYPLHFAAGRLHRDLIADGFLGLGFIFI